MKNLSFNKVWIGIILGLILPLLVYMLYYYLVSIFNLARVNVSLCMAANLIPFYLSLNREMYNTTKGVIVATLAWGAIIAYLSFCTNYFQIL
jgi:hypothetical protein